MERKEESLTGKDGGAGSDNNNNNNNNIPFLDRSKVRILLCDNNMKSSGEVFTLLCKCSYQVTSVRTPRQVVDALNAEGPDIDLILSEVDLPVAKGLKMLKYIMRDKELRRIPIIMMSAQDDVSVVVKCLRRGAADYLVKPLRTNELLNLWTHMWRRRHMLGLAEKNIVSYDFDLVASDPSDPNTNSTTLLSDDTDDKSRRSTIPEMTNCRKDDFSVATFLEPPPKDSSEYHRDVPGPSELRMGQISSFLKKSELKIGKSSAFFTYVKSSSIMNNSSKVVGMNDNAAKSDDSSREQIQACYQQQGADVQRQQTQVSWENYCSNGFPSNDNELGITNVERSCTPLPLENPDGRNSKEEEPFMVLSHPRNEARVDVSGSQAPTHLPYYLPGMMNHVMMPSPAQMYQGNTQDLPKNTASSMLAPYNHLPQHVHVPGMSSFPYYPVHICMQQGKMPATHMWPSNGSTSTNEAKPTQFQRREAALIKFRQKRKDRCFDKKIRYINRKRLAERRPRVRGQFVRQANGVDVDLNGHPASVDDSYADEEEDVDEELA